MYPKIFVTFKLRCLPVYCFKLELSRAHTLCALSICKFLRWDRPVMLTISTSPVVCMSRSTWPASACKYTICDVHGSCLTIRSTFKPVCRWFRLIGYAYELLRCLNVTQDLAIFVVTTDWRTDRQTDWLLYTCACALGNNLYLTSQPVSLMYYY